MNKIFLLCIFSQLTIFFTPATKSATTLPDDYAVIYIYRVEEANKLDSRKVKVKLNGKEFIDMPEDTFIGLKLPPGKHEFKMRQKQSEILLQVEAGKSYYIRVSQTVAGFGFNQTIYIMQPEQAVYQMRNMKILEDKNIKDKAQEFIKTRPI